MHEIEGSFINNGLHRLDMPSSCHPIATGIVILLALILNQDIRLPRWFRRWLALRERCAQQQPGQLTAPG